MRADRVKEVKRLALEVIVLCDEYARLQAESDRYYDNRGDFTVIVPPRGAQTRKPFHPPITGRVPAHLRRSSMDLSHALADLRKP